MSFLVEYVVFLVWKPVLFMQIMPQKSVELGNLELLKFQSFLCPVIISLYMLFTFAPFPHFDAPSLKVGISIMLRSPFLQKCSNYLLLTLQTKHELQKHSPWCFTSSQNPKNFQSKYFWWSCTMLEPLYLHFTVIILMILKYMILWFFIKLFVYGENLITEGEVNNYPLFIGNCFCIKVSSGFWTRFWYNKLVSHFLIR